MSTVCSIFSQVLKLIPRADFDAAVRKHRAERNAKGKRLKFPSGVSFLMA